MAKTLRNNSFRDTPTHVLERVARSLEDKYEVALRRDKDPQRVTFLFDLCHVLWTAIALKERDKLSGKKDKALFKEFSSLMGRI